MRSIVASDLMNPEVLSVPEDMTVAELAAFLLDSEITGAPVEGANGGLVGVVTLADIVAAACDEAADDDEEPDREGGERDSPVSTGIEDDSGSPAWGDLLVRDIMDCAVPSVRSDASVGEIAEKMLREHQHRLLVLEESQIVGIISTSDLLGLFVEED